MSPPAERAPPLPLPVALLSPLRPGEGHGGRTLRLFVIIAVRVVVRSRTAEFGKNLAELGEEEGLETAAGLSHF